MIVPKDENIVVPAMSVWQFNFRLFLLEVQQDHGLRAFQSPDIGEDRRMSMRYVCEIAVYLGSFIFVNGPRMEQNKGFTHENVILLPNAECLLPECQDAILVSELRSGVPLPVIFINAHPRDPCREAGIGRINPLKPALGNVVEKKRKH